MAPSSFSLLLRHLFTASKLQNRLLLRPLTRQISVSPFCSSLQSNPSPHPKSPSSLSARLSFVFDQIDQIEKERAEKDDALQRIKAWRESKKIKQAPEESGTTGGGLEGQEVGISAANGSGGILVEVITNEQSINREGHYSTSAKKEIELAHPWPEWIEFVERLVRHNYFDHRRKDEDMVITNSGLDDLSDVAAVEEVFDFTRDWKSVQTAVLNFGRDRFDIFRSLSRQDIQILVGYGCPSTDRKLIFSAKLLRKYVHLDEGDVCSTCSLRSTCEKAYLLTNNDDEARSIDVVRVLLTYAFEPINGSVENKSLVKHKSIKTVIRKLLHEVVKLSSVPIDPTLPPPVIKKRPPKVKQPPPPPKRRVGRDDVEMKKGDWLCPKCDFMNFAKNVICLQCDAKRPKRQLLPGEWECPKCNFLNYRRNMACFHCEHKRPADDFSENQMRMQHQELRTSNLERAVNRAEVYNAWNFDFDDDESDGADVAAFEYADTLKGGGTRSDPHVGSVRMYPGSDQRSQDAGFKDFDDDEEDDDINSYELEDPKKVRREEMSTVEISDVEGNLLSDDDSNDDLSGPRSGRMGSRSSRRHTNGLREDDIDFGSDDDLPVHPKWKSSHVADFRPRGSGRSRGFNSDEDDIYGGHELNSGFRSSAVGGRRRSRGGSSHGRDLSRKRSDFGPRRNNRREELPWSDFRPRRNNERGEVPSGGGRRQNWSLSKESYNRSNMGGGLAEEEKPRRVRINVR